MFWLVLIPVSPIEFSACVSSCLEGATSENRSIENHLSIASVTRLIVTCLICMYIFAQMVQFFVWSCSRSHFSSCEHRHRLNHPQQRICCQFSHRIGQLGSSCTLLTVFLLSSELLVNSLRIPTPCTAKRSMDEEQSEI